MELSDAVSTIEYKISTYSTHFNEGFVLKMDIHPGWPSEYELQQKLQRMYPFMSIKYHFLDNEVMQLSIQKITPSSFS
ncbi:MAG: hypothetical protein JST52_07550 [Bacteroidetes bacterium]|nr:hypothetical protein [Bacteroidota bacterium]MBS1739062.1 hypothetical protein [Bacteroidota bacterium]MBS1777362.1 hypothetical protein [Bacteroidota bacterium]